MIPGILGSKTEEYGQEGSGRNNFIRIDVFFSPNNNSMGKVATVVPHELGAFTFKKQGSRKLEHNCTTDYHLCLITLPIHCS